MKSSTVVIFLRIIAADDSVVARRSKRWQELVQRRRAWDRCRRQTSSRRGSRLECALQRAAAAVRPRCVGALLRRARGSSSVQTLSNLCGRCRRQSSTRTFSARRAPMQDAIRIEDHALQRGGVQDVLRRRNLQDHLQHSQRMRQAVKLEPGRAAGRGPRTPPPPTPPPAITEALCPQCGLCTGEPLPAPGAAPMEAALAAWRGELDGGSDAHRAAARDAAARDAAAASAARRRHGARPLDAQLDRRDDPHPPDAARRQHAAGGGGGGGGRELPRCSSRCRARRSTTTSPTTATSACSRCAPARTRAPAVHPPLPPRVHRPLARCKRVCPSCKFDVSGRGAES